MIKRTFHITWIYTQIILLAILHAFNYHLFITPNNFAPAGITGIATMIQYKTGFSLAYMSILINVPLCIFGYFFVCRTFACRSLCFALVYSGTYLLLQQIGLESLQYNAQGQDTVIPAILSGFIGGVVYGLCHRTDSSTGGTDILSKFISKHRPRLNTFYISFALNAIVAIASFFVYARRSSDGTLCFNYKPVCLCVMYCFLSSSVGNHIIRGLKSAYKFTIITSHTEEITEEIHHTLKHGTTRISGLGGFSLSPRDVIICVVNKHQLVDFQNILKKYDDTFSFSESVAETYGNFKFIK